MMKYSPACLILLVHTCSYQDCADVALLSSSTEKPVSVCAGGDLTQSGYPLCYMIARRGSASNKYATGLSIINSTRGIPPTYSLPHGQGPLIPKMGGTEAGHWSGHTRRPPRIHSQFCRLCLRALFTFCKISSLRDRNFA